MSRENVEIVRKGFDAVNALLRGELSVEAAAEVPHRQFEFHWHDAREMPDTPQHLRGSQEFLRMAEQVRSAWTDLVLEPLEISEAPDDRVLILIRQSGRGHESGVPIELHYFHVWTIRDGKVRNIEQFRHHVDALEAAGLSE